MVTNKSPLQCKDIFEKKEYSNEEKVEILNQLLNEFVDNIDDHVHLLNSINEASIDNLIDDKKNEHTKYV
ncbi:unnamed protein product [Rotaria magnacalcarata]